MVPELQMQVTQSSSQGVSPYSSLSSSFPNQTTAPTMQTFSGHPQQHQISSQQTHQQNNPHHPHLQGSNHATGSQQAYAIRLAKDRQRYLQQQQFVPPNALMPHNQPQNQLPITSSVQNGSQIQSQASSQPASMPPLTSSSAMTPISSQHQLKHLSSHGLGQSPQAGASGLNNQMGKQRQRQPQPQQQLQQSGRSHPQQRQHAQSQHQAKVVKGVGRGNMLVQQNLGIDPSQLNGLSMPSGNQSTEKGEHMHLMQGQSLYSGSGVNTVQPSKSYIPPSSNQSKMPQKLYSGPVPPPSKQIQHIPAHFDNVNQAPTVTSGHAYSASHQAIPSSATVSGHQQLQPHAQQRQNQVNQTQPTVQRVLQQNRQVISDSNKSSSDQAQTSHHLPNNASQGVSSVAMPQSSNESPNILPASSAETSQWKDSEPVHDSGMPKPSTQVGSSATPPLLNSNGGEPVSPLNQGLGQRQLSGSLPSHGQNAGAQWQQQQQQQLPVQQFPTPPPPSQHHQTQEQLVHNDQNKSS